LYLTGQDIVALGLPSALSAGFLTANVLMGYDNWENAILQRDIVDDMGKKMLLFKSKSILTYYI